LGGARCAGADQFTALLGPETVAAGEDPHRPGAEAGTARVVVGPADDGGVAVARHRYGHALDSACSNRSDQLRPLLRELRQGQLR